MPLQNRVDPFGRILAVPERGLLMGNRGGRLHDPATRTLLGRTFASRRWICCTLAERGRPRRVMGAGYTELFFLDEVVALAAGHRPCFACRGDAARAFAHAFGGASAMSAPTAEAIDHRLHAERRSAERPDPARRRHAAGALPDGAIYAAEGTAFALRGSRRLKFGFGGWSDAGPRPDGPLALLTPLSTLAALAHGYRPLWHPSADV
ncbi:hypothetical protein [Aquabacter spiritensis]|uniref:Uncharacterized protein n=1 Tax=Aquabacter spiritensis TaxID=933073 RepID=A0A4V2UYB8_9HYPH|nr:hypothetical protein [Aquabacter spiritensis]TCT06788.1 hypothetical protein EDC64_102268 [Aquabacter spiritensis]